MLSQGIPKRSASISTGDISQARQVGSPIIMAADTYFYCQVYNEGTGTEQSTIFHISILKLFVTYGVKIGKLFSPAGENLSSIDIDNSAKGSNVAETA